MPQYALKIQIVFHSVKTLGPKIENIEVLLKMAQNFKNCYTPINILDRHIAHSINILDRQIVQITRSSAVFF